MKYIGTAYITPELEKDLLSRELARIGAEKFARQVIDGKRHWYFTPANLNYMMDKGLLRRETHKQ